MTITLAPQLETRLRRKAARIGQEADALAGTLLWDALADEVVDEEVSEGEQREEYHNNKQGDCLPLGNRGIASCLPKAIFS